MISHWAPLAGSHPAPLAAPGHGMLCGRVPAAGGAGRGRVLSAHWSVLPAAAGADWRSRAGRWGQGGEPHAAEAGAARSDSGEAPPTPRAPPPPRCQAPGPALPAAPPRAPPRRRCPGLPPRGPSRRLLGPRSTAWAPRRGPTRAVVAVRPGPPGRNWRSRDLEGRGAADGTGAGRRSADEREKICTPCASQPRGTAARWGWKGPPGPIPAMG